MTFPLYDKLMNESSINEIPLNEKESIINTIKKSSLKEHELLYALIRKHQISTIGSSCSYIFPYNAKRLKKGIKFDFDKLPIKLQNIISSYIKYLNK